MALFTHGTGICSAAAVGARLASRTRWIAPLFALACAAEPGTTQPGTGTDATTSAGPTTGGSTSGPTSTTHDPTTGSTTGSTTTGEPDPTTGSPTTTGTTGDDTTAATTGTVDPPMSLDDIVDGELELIANGHMFTEGPVWSPDGYLLYSDIPADTIFRWAEGEGSAPFITPSGNSNGLAFDGMGRLLAAEHGLRRVSRRVIDEAPEVVVDQYMGLPLNSPNDVVWRSDGTIYFTDPPYGIDPNMQEQPFQGVFRVDPQGVVSLVADDFDRPNGLALAPDESLLYVDDTALEHVRMFDVQPDGSTAGGAVFVDLASDLQGDPDGMAVDVFGDLYVTGGGGVRVVTPAGAVLGTIPVPESTTNCTFGDPDGRALFITAPPRVYRVRLKVAGAP
jgi:gluconolactonase